MREAAESGLCVRPVGGGTKLDRSADSVDVELSTAGLDRILEHNAGDLTAVLQAGVPLARAQEVFAAEGQMLALDPPGEGATIGGVVATADSGPLRHRYGGVRDLVIGVTVALSDGTVARSGGKVIKNVAGYDLAKLVAGSWGTLGVILEVVVRLHPIPRAAGDRGLRAGERRRARPQGARALARAARARVPRRPPGRAARHRPRTLRGRSRGRAGERAGRGPSVEDDEELWARQRDSQAGALRVSALSADWPRLCRTTDRAGGTLVGRGALGLAWFAGADEAVVRAAFPERTRSEAEVELMRRVQARFDVHGALVA